MSSMPHPPWWRSLFAPGISPVFQAVLAAMLLTVGFFLVRGWIDYAQAASNGAIIVNRDFQVYYFATKAFWSGHSPYDLQYVSLSMPRPAWSPFVYPPYALYLFYPFTLLELGVAMLVWLAIKLFAIVMLFVGWTKLYRDLAPLRLLLPFALFAFSGAIVYDIHTGNIGTIEACLLVWAIYWLDRDRPVAFVALVLAAAAMKMVPLIFLLVPFFVRPLSQAMRLAIGAAVAVGALWALAYVAAPPLFTEWLLSAKQVDWLSRSFYGLAVQVHTFIDPTVDPALARRVALAVHLLIAAAIVATTWLVLRARRQEADALVYAVIVLALLLCWPRLWRYTFANAIAPILVIAALDCRNGKWGILRAVGMTGMALLLQHGTRARVPIEIIHVFKELAATLLPWINGLWMLKRQSRAIEATLTTVKQGSTASP
jgi:alpha-1,2-mannosyltransferase